MLTTLDMLKIGNTGYIYDIKTSKYIKKRLLDLGLINGTKIKALYKSPFNDPTSYLVRSSVIALRSSDCKNIIIEIGDIQNE